MQLLAFCNGVPISEVLIEFKSLNVTSEKACVIVTNIVEIFGFNLHINVLN